MNIVRKVNNRSIVKDKNDETIKPLFDIKTLDFYCRYVISMNQNIRISNLNLIRELFNRVDENQYGSDIDRIDRIKFIKRGLEARIDKKLTNKDMIIQYINGGIMDKSLLDTSSMEEISDEVLAYLNEQANELVKSYFVDDRYDEILSLASNLHNANYARRSDVVNQIQQMTADLNMQFNKMDDSISQSQMFTLMPNEFESVLSDVHARQNSPSRILRTGITGLNMMLDGGFQATRVYILFAQAAGGKSFTMLDLAMQIKKYNKDYIPHDPTKIPTIVFLTMENSEDENIARMMSMVSGGKTLNDCSLEDSINIFRQNGLGYDKDTDPIDLVMIYKPNLSVNTDYLYTLTDKLRESGREPICIFQDHIKRIRPVNRRNDLRLDLGEIVNEFKAFANATNIPVITDSHLNRDASKVLDDSSSANKKDLIRSLGSFNVSESYLMIDNCDLGIIINKESDSHDNNYMGFKCIKTRTKCTLDLFYQPYLPMNNIKLTEDLYATVPSFKRQLKDENQVSRTRISKRISHSDDDDLFGQNVMGSETNNEPGKRVEDVGVAYRPVTNILLARNENQDSFVVSGKPSAPAIPFRESTPVETTLIMNRGISEWEQHLLDRKIMGDNSAIVFIDDNGSVIHDGILAMR